MFLEGKVSAQPIHMRFNSGNPQPLCDNCRTLVEKPKKVGCNFKTRMQLLFSYFDTPYFIYESKSGYSVIYCSKECRDQHNHRFNKQ